MVDILIQNALIYDGTGSKPFTGFVGIRNDKISLVGQGSPTAVTAKHTVDAKGLCLSPGFIDVHSHSDYVITADPHRVHILQMGVTTEIAGQCGTSRSPAVEDMPPGVRASVQKGHPTALAATMAEQLEIVRKLPLGTNQCYFTGHGLLRADVMGLQARDATPEFSAPSPAILADMSVTAAFCPGKKAFTVSRACLQAFTA